MTPQKTLAQGTQAGDGVHIGLLGVPLLTEGLLSAPLAAVDALLLWRLADEGPQPGERLARQIWPAQAGAAASNNLRQRVFRLRRRRVPLLLRDGILQLDGCAAVDLLAPDPGRHLAPTAWASSELLDGVEVDHGDLADLLEQGREHWRRQRLQLARAHVVALREQGDDTQALAWMQSLLAAMPDDDEACRTVMALHLQRGDRAAAVDAFEQAERWRRQQGRAAPDARSVALLQAALHGPAPAGASTVEPTRAAEQAAAAGAVRPLPVALLRPPRLIERQEVLQRVVGAWRGARLPILLGEAGIGKSRLAQELLALAADGGRQILALGCAELGGEPYALLSSLLDRVLRALPTQAMDALPWTSPDAPLLALLLPQWSPRLAAQSERALQGLGTGALLRQATRHWLAAGLAQLADRQPLLVLVDDLHLADHASLEVLQGWLGGAATAAVPGCSWLLTARPAELPPVLLAMMEQWRSGAALEEATLAPWSATGIGALLDDLHWPASMDAAALRQQVGGNPFHVLEALRQAWSEAGTQPAVRLDMASTAAQRILLRLGRLGEQARQLAELAALAGACWRADLAGQALGMPLLALADSWRELEDAQVFAGDARTAGLAHDLVRVAVLQQLPDGRRQRLCDRLATLLADRGDAPAAELGRLWEGAARWPQAAAAWTAASQHARRLGRPVEQLQQARQAIQAWGRAGQPGQAFDLWFHCSDAMTLTRSTTGLDELIDELEGWADTPARRGRCAALRAFCRLNQSRLDDALALTNTALAQAASDDHELLIDSLRTRAQTLIVQGRIEQAGELLAAQQARVDAHATPLQRLQHLATQSLLYNHQRQVGRSIEALQQASALARELGDPLEEVVHRQNLAVSLGHAGRLHEALAAARQARQMHARLDSLLGLHGPISRVNEAQIQLQFGRFDLALPEMEAALADIPPAAAVWYHATRHRLALAWLWVGQLGRAGSLLAEDLPAGLPPATLSLREQLRALLTRYEDGRFGAPTPAERAHLERARSAWAGLTLPQIPLEHNLRLCRGLTAQDALVQADQVANLARQRGAFGLELTARVLHAELLSDQDPAVAADDIERVLPRLPHGLAVEWLPTELLHTCAQVLDGAGRSDQALQARREAARWLAAAEAATPAEWRGGLRGRNPWHRALAGLRLDPAA